MRLQKSKARFPHGSVKHTRRPAMRAAIGRFLRQHWFSLGLCVLAAIAATTFIAVYARNANEQITKNNAHAQQLSDEWDAHIAEARRIAAEKAAREAAEKAAEAARTATPETSDQIDATACNSATTHKDPSDIDVVVNKKHCLQPLDFAPSDLVSVHGALLGAKAATAFSALFTAAQAAGQSFTVTSSYRSYADQVSTYAYWVSVSGRDGADTYSARPGYSEHQTGLAMDLQAPGCALDCFGQTSQYQWLQAHAAEYGFVQRYYAGKEAITGYKAEEWHYRYVGVAVAQDMKAKGIQTLEEYWNIPGGLY